MLVTTEDSAKETEPSPSDGKPGWMRFSKGDPDDFRRLDEVQLRHPARFGSWEADLFALQGQTVLVVFFASLLSFLGLTRKQNNTNIFFMILQMTCEMKGCENHHMASLPRLPGFEPGGCL